VNRSVYLLQHFEHKVDFHFKFKDRYISNSYIHCQELMVYFYFYIDGLMKPRNSETKRKMMKITQNIDMVPPVFVGWVKSLGIFR
jgi:hypothetical protein